MTTQTQAQGEEKTIPVVVLAPSRPEYPHYIRAGIWWKHGRSYHRVTPKQYEVLRADKMLSVMELSEEQYVRETGDPKVIAAGGPQRQMELTAEEQKLVELYRRGRAAEIAEQQARAAQVQELASEKVRAEEEQRQALRDEERGGAPRVPAPPPPPAKEPVTPAQAEADAKAAQQKAAQGPPPPAKEPEEKAPKAPKK
jgi:hypothetical protein